MPSLKVPIRLGIFSRKHSFITLFYYIRAKIHKRLNFGPRSRKSEKHIAASVFEVILPIE